MSQRSSTHADVLPPPSPPDLTKVSDGLFIGSHPRDEESVRALVAKLESDHGSFFKIVSCLSLPEQTTLRAAELWSSAVSGLADQSRLDYFPMAPNTPGAFKQLLRFCITHDTYFAKEERHVLIVLCKTGRGRSAMLAACLLLHLSKVGHAMTTDEAIAEVCKERPAALHHESGAEHHKGDAASGALCFPSQVRYVHYYEHLLRSPKGEFTQTLRLNAVRVTTIPRFDASIVNQGCSPVAVVCVLAQVAEPTALESQMPFQSHVALNQAKTKKTPRFYSQTKGEKEIEIDLRDASVSVRGDTIVSLFSGEHKMLQVCFHTAFVEQNYLCFDQSTLDLAHLDVHHRRFDPAVKVELFFSRVTDAPELNVGDLVPKGGVSAGGSGGEDEAALSVDPEVLIACSE